MQSIGEPGKTEELCEGFLEDVSRSGNYALISDSWRPGYNRRLISLAGSEKRLTAFPQNFQSITDTKLSPDDKLLAYVSTETGPSDVSSSTFQASPIEPLFHAEEGDRCSGIQTVQNCSISVSRGEP